MNRSRARKNRTGGGRRSTDWPVHAGVARGEFMAVSRDTDSTTHAHRRQATTHDHTPNAFSPETGETGRTSALGLYPFRARPILCCYCYDRGYGCIFIYRWVRARTKRIDNVLIMIFIRCDSFFFFSIMITYIIVNENDDD